MQKQDNSYRQDPVVNFIDEKNDLRHGIDSSQIKPKKIYDFEFTGNGAEYFKIWIVNLALNILTLSLYQPWAKVRNKRYFYGNTLLDGHSFEYDADPFKIFKGRLIAIVFFITYFALSQGGQMFLFIAFGLLMISVPFFVLTAIRFNARYSSYRGIRFAFAAGYPGVAGYFYLLPILSLLTFTLLTPYAWFRKTAYYISEHRYGNKAFRYTGLARKFYVKLIMLIIIALCTILIVLGLYGGVIVLLKMLGIIDLSQNMHLHARISGFEDILTIEGVKFLIVLFMLYSIFMPVYAYFQYKKFQLTFGFTQVADIQLKTQIKYFPYFVILYSNGIMTLLTMGLYYPWARIKVARYKASVTRAQGGSLNQFIAVCADEKSSLGDQVGEVFDLDIGL